MKTILKFVLYAGAALCCLAGWGAAYMLVVSFKETQSKGWPYELALAVVYIFLAFTPCVMFLTGLKTKTLQWVTIAMVEVIVLAPVSYLLVACIMVLLGRVAI